MRPIHSHQEREFGWGLKYLMPLVFSYRAIINHKERLLTIYILKHKAMAALVSK